VFDTTALATTSATVIVLASPIPLLLIPNGGTSAFFPSAIRMELCLLLRCPSAIWIRNWSCLYCQSLSYRGLDRVSQICKGVNQLLVGVVHWRR
jgi:hypothetical protein